MYKLKDRNDLGIIVQARTRSNRLPSKMLLDFQGKTIIEQILIKLKKCKLVKKIICAIPEGEDDDILYSVVKRIQGIFIFRGSHTDLVKRYLDSSKKYNIEIIGRFPADNILPDPELIDQAFEFYCKNKFDFVSNLNNIISKSGYPDGCGIEVFSRNLLKNLYLNNFCDKKSLEHIALNFYDYEKGNAINNISASSPICPKDKMNSELILDINTIDDYIRLSKLTKKVMDYFKIELYENLNLSHLLEYSQIAELT